MQTASVLSNQQPGPQGPCAAATAIAPGLIHLVEAATALTQLDDVSRRPSVSCTDDQTKQPSSSQPEPLLSASPIATAVSDDDSDTPSRGRKKPHKSSSSNTASSQPKEIFPQRLLSILSQPALSQIITWLPHGQSFVVLRPDVFADQILAQLNQEPGASQTTKAGAPSKAKYPSFTRKLNRWGFRQISRGADAGAFHHPLFRRDQPELCRDMVCQKSRRRKSGVTTENKAAHASSPHSSKKTSRPEESGEEVMRLPPKKRKLSPRPSPAMTDPAPAIAPATTSSTHPVSPVQHRRVSSSSSLSSMDSGSTLSQPAAKAHASSTAPQEQPQLRRHNPILGSHEALLERRAEVNAALADLLKHHARNSGKSVDVMSPQEKMGGQEFKAPLMPRALAISTPALPSMPQVAIEDQPVVTLSVQAQRARAESAKNMLYEAYLQALGSNK